MKIATVNGGHGDFLPCTVLQEGVPHAHEGLLVIAFYEARGEPFTVLGRLGPVDTYGHPSGVDIVTTEVQMVGFLDGTERPAWFRHPPTGTIFERATDGDLAVFNRAYGRDVTGATA